jgi:signal transduction histidine kinase
MRAAVQAVVAQSLLHVTLWLAPLLLLFAPLDYLYSPAPSGHTLAALDLALGLFLLAAHLLVRTGLIRPSAAHPATGLVVLAVLPYLLGNLVATGDPVQSAGWALWQVCLSLVVLSWPWLVGLLLLSNVLWAVTVVQLPPSPAWQQYAYVLATASVIAIVAHGVRLRTIRRLEGLRIAESHRRMELERAQHAAREVETVRRVNVAKTQFINTAAHELSTPLTPIVLQVRMLRKGPQDNLTDRQRRHIEVLDRNVGRLSALLHDVLDSARLQSDRFHLVRASVDLGDLLRAAAADHEEVARHAGVHLAVRAPASGLQAQADVRRLAQVVANLVGNALKFTPRGGHVELRALEQAGELRVEVADDGLGLAAGSLPSLFQPFVQVHTDPSLPGTGLGRYISRGIVEAHGGRMGVTSPGLGQGATFWFTVPRGA